MNTERLKKQLQDIAATNPEGFTYSPSKLGYPQKGYVVATECTQDCVGNSGMFRVIKFYLKHTDFCIGGWRNEDGSMQYDASKIYYSLEEAVKAAIDNQQRAFYNLYTNSVISSCEYYRILGKSERVA